MADYLAQVAQQVRDADEARERSQQTDLGWSNMADCRAYMGFVAAGEWASDAVETWRANVGTALHDWLTMVRRNQLNRFGQTRASFNLEVSYRGIRGHVDEVIWEDGEITDYKFPRLASARVWDDPRVLDEKFVQVQGYAAAIINSHMGWQSKAPRPHTALVRMLVMPVDGTFDDWKVYEREYDQRVADDAVDRYQFVQTALGAGETLPRDKPLFWCERFCEFFQLCRGGSDHGFDLPDITDEETAAALERYGEALMAKTAAEKQMDGAAELLRGAHGQARGWRVSMTRAGTGKWVPDESQIEADYGDEEVPKVWQEGQAPKLQVRRVRS